MAARLEQWDLETDKHFQEAVALATSGKIEELATWQEEFSRFQKLPRMVARAEQRQRTEEIAAMTKSLEQSPDPAAKWIELAKLEQLDGQPKLAASHFARGYGLQAMELARADKLDDAIEAERKATEHDSDVAQVQHARALIAVAQGRDKEASSLLDLVLSRTPTKSADRWQILSDRGEISLRLAQSMNGTRQDWDKARADFEAAIAQLSSQVPASGDTDSITTRQQTLTRLHHNRAITLEALAAAESTKPDLALLEQAEKSLLTAIGLNPKEPRFALSAGQNLIRQVRSAAPGAGELFDRAAKFLTTATKLDDKQAEAHFALGDCQLLRGKTADAQAAFDKAVALADREPPERQFQFFLNQSVAYLRAPRNDTKALAAADRAIALQRSSTAAHFARGSALRNLKRPTEAIGAFSDTLAAEPRHVGALTARSQLVIELENATPKQLDQASQDVETALAAAQTDELKAEAYYVRSLAALKTHVTNVAQAATAEPALLKAQRDLLQAVKLMPGNAVYAQAATELFDYAAKFVWSDTQRKTDSETLQRELKAVRRK